MVCGFFVSSSCFAMQYLVSSLVFFCDLDEEKGVGCFNLIVFLMSCNCWCSVAISEDVVGWSAVCDSGNSQSYLFCGNFEWA